MIAARAEVGPEHIQFTAHAVARFRERVRPELTYEQCEAQLVKAVTERGEIKLQRPKGIKSAGLRHQILTEGWLCLRRAGSLIVFPLVAHPNGLLATTCMTRRGS